MIITKTPYRIPIGGGGTDQEFYFKKKGSSFISLTFSEYIYVFVTERKLDNKIVTQTSDVEFRNNINSLSHPLIKATLKYFKIKNKIHIGTFSTLPTASGLGLGTSSSFLVGLVHAISIYKKIKLSKMKIAEIAFTIERKILKLSGGYQDQYISSLGGLRKFKITKNRKISSKKINLSPNIENFINKNFILVYSNKQRKSEKIIESQKYDLKKTIKIYDKIKQISNKIEKYLTSGNFVEVANLFNLHWNLKRGLSKKISSNKLDKNIENYLNNGALGGKMIGAGGGGFYLLIKDPKSNILLKYLKSQNVYTLNFKIDYNGTKQISII